MNARTRCKALCHSYFMLCGMAAGLVFPLVKSFEDTYGISHTQIGILLGASSVLVGLSTIMGGYIYDRKGPRVLLSVGTLLWALSTAFRADMV